MVEVFDGDSTNLKRPGVVLMGKGNDSQYHPLLTDSSGVPIVAILPSTTTSPAKAEDAAHASGDVGILSLFVRNDAEASRTSADADYAAPAVDSAGRVKVAAPNCWAVSHVPAAGTKATISQANVAGTRHVCTSVSFAIHTVAAPSATTLNVALRDGATGAGTVLHQWSVRVPATADLNVLDVHLTGLSIPGTANTAMTLEFSAALAETVQSVNLAGYDLT